MSSPVLLCVDDRPQMLQVRKTNLEPLGFAVVSATSTSTAIAMLEKTDIDAVLVEYRLEGIDAEAVAFHIKQRFPNQPIVLLSAYSDMPERILWLVDEFVTRSEPLERLAEVIGQVTYPTVKIPPGRHRLQRPREAVA